jgi:DHA2 family methylenomycin A resistance protein-like MFS transporter
VQDRVRRALVLAATSAAAFTATLDNTVVAVALRDVQADLGAGVAELQGVVTAYTVALAALLLTGGTLADVAGRRRVLLAGLAVFAAASAACALADSAGALIAARAVQGAGAALVLPGGLAVLAAAYPEGAGRARAVGIWAATGALALVLGPAVGGLLVAASGWPAVFWVNLPLCALVAVVVLLVSSPVDLPGECLAPDKPARRVPDARSEDPPGGDDGRRRALDLPGQMLGALALAAGTYAVVLAGRDGLGAPVAVAAAAAVVSAVAFAAVERRADHPVLPLELVRQRGFLGATLGAFAASLAVFVLLVFVSLFLQLVQERDALPAALRLLPLTLALVVTAPAAGRWAASKGPRPPVVVGLVLTAAGLALTGVRLAQDLGDVELAVLLGVCGLGIGLTTAPVVTASLDAVARSRSGLAAATVNVARELGGVVAVAGLGALVVARLGTDLTRRLLELGVPDERTGTLVEALLRGASQREVLRLSGEQVPLDALLELADAARASYVTSVRLALLGAAVVVLLTAGVTARWLQPGVDQLDDA